MKLAILQFRPFFNAPDKTIHKLEKMFCDAKKADLVVLPELANSGYHFSSAKEAGMCAEDVHDSRFIDFLKKTAQKNDQLIVSGFNEREGAELFNSAVLVDKNGLQGKYRKLHLFKKEKQYFKPGNLGLPLFLAEKFKIGMLVCFDWMFPETWRLLAMKGADIICAPSNLVLPGKAQKAIPVHAMINRIFIALANRTGREGDLQFTGNSLIAGPEGEILGEGNPADEQVIFADIEINRAKDKWITPENHAFQDIRKDVYKLKTLRHWKVVQ